MASPTTPSNNIYATIGNSADKVMKEGRLLHHSIKEFLNKQHELIKENDSKLYPVALTAAIVTLLAINAFSSSLFFALGALYTIAKKDKWKEGLVTPIKDFWKSSTVGKVLLAGFFLFIVAPNKWNIAAFALGIHVVQEIRKSKHDPSSNGSSPKPPDDNGKGKVQSS